MDAGPRERTAPGLAAGAWLVRRGLGRDCRIVGSAVCPDLGHLAAGHRPSGSAGLGRRNRRADRLRPTVAPPQPDRAVAGRGDTALAGCGGAGLRALQPRQQLHLLMTTATMFACPGCGAETPAGTVRCELCRIRLTGELAMQLWRLDQELGTLTERRLGLVEALRRDDETVPRPMIVIRPAPGTETRRLLLVLGVVCVVGALSAATALIWPALGPGGQTALLALVTVALLVGATRLGRLPATAEAIATIGVAATAVDVVAGRRLVASGIGGPASHAYWVIATALAAAMLAVVAARARWLHAPAVGAVVATFALVVAVVQPRTASAYAVVGLVEVVLGLGIARLASSVSMSATAVRAAALAGTAAFTLVTAVASLQAAVERAPALWCGVALGVGAVVTRSRWVAVAGGAFAGFLLALAPVVPVDRAPLMVAGVAAALLLASWLPVPSGWTLFKSVGVGVAVVCGLGAEQTMQLSAADGHDLGVAAAGLMLIAVVLASVSWLSSSDETAIVASAATTAVGALALVEATGGQGADVTAGTTAVFADLVALVALAATATLSRARLAWTAGAVAAVSVVVASIASDVALSLRGTDLVEAYVAVPAVFFAALGAVAMLRLPSASSWLLAPSIAIVLLPSLALALHGDTGRQVLVIAAGLLLVLLGAQWRLACPLAAGAIAMTLVVLRVLGPEVAQLPRWVSLGVAGALLIGVGATWEKRLTEIRLTGNRLRPVVEALR